MSAFSLQPGESIDLCYLPGESPEEKWNELTRESYRARRRAALERGVSAAELVEMKRVRLRAKIRFFERYCPPIRIIKRGAPCSEG